MFGQRGGVAGGVDVGQHLADVRLGDPIGATVLFGSGRADVDFGTQRFGDLGAQILTYGATGDAAEHLAEDESEGGHVIALRGPRLPPRFGLGQTFAHDNPSR